MNEEQILIYIGEVMSLSPISSSSELRTKGQALIYLADRIEATHKEQEDDVRTAVDSSS